MTIRSWLDLGSSGEVVLADPRGRKRGIQGEQALGRVY